MRQKPYHALHRRHRASRFGQDRGQRHGVLRPRPRQEGARGSFAAAAQNRLAVPELHAVPQPDRGAERGGGHRQGRLAGRPRRHGAGRAQALRPVGLREALSRAALRRPAAARGACAHARGASGHPHARRAVLRARCASEKRSGAEPGQPVRRVPRHHPVRVARHRRGAALLRPHRRG